MVDFDKAIKAIDKQIDELKKKKEIIANFDDYDLIKKLEIVRNTNELRYQREETGKYLINSFKSKLVREKGVGRISVNFFIIDVEGFKIYIPMDLSKRIYMGYMSENLKKDKLYDITKDKENLLQLEEEKENTIFFQYKYREVLDNEINNLKHKIDSKIKENKKIININKEKDEIIKYNKKVLIDLKEDLELFKSDNYNFEYTIDQISHFTFV